MPALVAGIHVLSDADNKDVDGLDKPGHDGERERSRLIFYVSASAPRVSFLTGTPGFAAG